MVKYVGSDVDDSKSFDVIPEGRYPVFIESITLRTTQKGDEMWSVKHRVRSGEHKGAGFYDNIVWSDKESALVRAKQFLKCFGVYEDSKVDYNAWELEGKEGVVNVVIGEWKGQKRNEIPFNGYYTYHNEESTSLPRDNNVDIPF